MCLKGSESKYYGANESSNQFMYLLLRSRTKDQEEGLLIKSGHRNIKQIHIDNTNKRSK